MLVDPSYILGRSRPERVKDSIAALELFYRLEEEGRSPTEKERSDLARFAGAGSFYNLFRDNQVPAWEQECRERLKAIRVKNPHDYKSLERTVLNAYYTAPDIIFEMWDTAQRLGFEGGKVIDPGCGAICSFYLFCPPKLREKIEYVGVEIDSVSARMAYMIFDEEYRQGRVKVWNKDFMKLAYPMESIDLAIGNLPFIDGTSDKYGGLSKPVGLHAQIMMKTLDLLKPGGLSVMISSTGTLDSIGANREYRDFRKDYTKAGGAFLGAARLPCESHKPFGTEAMSDIIATHKNKDGGFAFPALGWAETGDSDLLTEDGKPCRINQYFIDRPHQLIGEPRIDKTTASQDRFALTWTGDRRSMIERLRSALANIGANTVAEEDRAGYVKLEVIDGGKNESLEEQEEMYAKERGVWGRFKITMNEELGGIEIRFPCPIPESVSDELDGMLFVGEFDGKARRTKPKFYRYKADRSGEEDPRWVIRYPVADAIAWCYRFASQYDHYGATCDLPFPDPVAESLPMTVPPTNPAPVRLHLEVVPSEPKAKPKTTANKSSIFDDLDLFCDSLVADALAIAEAFDERKIRLRQIMQQVSQEVKNWIAAGYPLENDSTEWTLFLLQSRLCRIVVALSIKVQSIAIELPSEEAIEEPAGKS